MVVINIGNVVHILHIHPFPFEFLPITKFKENFIKHELFLSPLLRKIFVMAIEILLHDRVLNGEILLVCLREILGSFMDQVYYNVNML